MVNSHFKLLWQEKRLLLNYLPRLIKRLCIIDNSLVYWYHNSHGFSGSHFSLTLMLTSFDVLRPRHTPTNAHMPVHIKWLNIFSSKWNFLLDKNISFSYWPMMPLQAIPKPLYATYWWSNHFISEFQNFYKILANELVSCMMSWGSVPRAKLYLSVLFKGVQVFSFGVECHAVASTVQWETAHIRTPLSFSPRWLQDVKKECSHLPILPNFFPSCRTPISFTFSWGSQECKHLSFVSNVTVYYRRG